MGFSGQSLSGKGATKTIQPKDPIKNLKKIGRNEKIAIKSPSGRKIEIKYKKLEHYLKQGYTQL